MAKTLIVVYKENDELGVNQLRKMIEARDDETEKIVGVEDETVKMIAWTEKVWLQQKESGKIASKVLLIDDIKGSKSLMPIIDVKFDKHGIVYGWAGSMAIISVDETKLHKKEAYDAFLEDLKAETNSDIAGKERKQENNLSLVKKSLWVILFPVLQTIFAGKLIKDAFDDKKLVRQQMLLYAVTEMYLNDLDAFMKE